MDGTLRMWQPKKPGGEPEILKSTARAEEIGAYTCACCHPTKPIIFAGTEIGSLALALYSSHKVWL